VVKQHGSAMLQDATHTTHMHIIEMLQRFPNYGPRPSGGPRGHCKWAAKSRQIMGEKMFYLRYFFFYKHFLIKQFISFLSPSKPSKMHHQCDTDR